MGTIFKFFILFVSFGTFAQELNGIEEYQFTEKLDFTNDRQYIVSEGTYDFQVQDAYDNVISLTALETVWDEMFRIMEANNIEDVTPFVMYGPQGLRPEYIDIVNKIKKGCNYIIIRYDMGNGYYAYLNLQDGFCGMAITKSKID
jgi:hypothetical protein